MVEYKPTFGEVIYPTPTKSDRDIYTGLTPASETSLGGVIVDGSSITIDDSGVISSTYELPIASNTILGGVKIDNSTIIIDENGEISTNLSGGAYILNPGTVVNREVVIWNGTIGSNVRTVSNVSINTIGTISAGADVIAFQTDPPAASFWDTMPAATSTTMGGFILDATQMEMNAGVLSIQTGVLTPADHEHNWNDITSGTQPDPVAHDLTSATYHTVAGLTTGQFLVATAADAVGFAPLAASPTDREILTWNGNDGTTIRTAVGVAIDDTYSVLADGDIIAYQDGSYTGSLWDAIPVDNVTLKYSGGYVSIKPTFAVGDAGKALIVSTGGTGVEWGTVSGGATWPSGGAGIPYYSGSSTWGTTHTLSGTGTELALTAGPTFTTATFTGKVTIGTVGSVTWDRELSVEDMYCAGNFQLALGSYFFFGPTTDSGARFKLFNTGGHAYFDYYDNLYFRSGASSSGIKVTFSNSGVITWSGGGSANANTAYADRMKWDGGSTDLVAATGRSSLGLSNSATITASDVAGNSTIVQRTANGYIFCNYLNTTANDVTSGVTKVMVETGDDNYIRHGSAQAIGTFISGTTMNIAGSSTSVTHNASRTDSTYYNVGWFSSTPSPAYSCDAVQIQSSTGTLKATTLKATGDIIAYTT